MDQNRVYFFDTTLRDGEQTPGVSLQTPEKIEIAKGLVRLGIDVIEAGFPAASPGDFEAVQTIAREVKGATWCYSTTWWVSNLSRLCRIGPL